MIVNTKYGKINSFELENWKELFIVKVTPDLVKDFYQINKFFRFWYSLKRYDQLRNYYDLTSWILTPYILIYNLWWYLGNYCNNKNWLKVEEGVKPNWFWPIYFFKQMSKPKPIDIEKLKLELNKK